MRDKPIVELETALETDLVKQVLADREIPFRMEMNMENALGLYLGAGSLQFQGYARVWGYEKDEDVILQAVEEVRASQPIEDLEEYLPKGRMWRIKKP